MPYRIKVQNKMGDWYSIFPEDERPQAFLYEIRNQGAQINLDGSFICDVYDIQPIIDSIDDYIKTQQRVFKTSDALRKRISIQQSKMRKGVYEVVANSLFDLTNEFVPSTNKGDTGYALEPTWRIIEKNAMTWIMFMNYNFIKFIESSIVRVDETHFKLQDGEKIRIIGEFRK